jgi:pyruvate dehydrogenase E2 component (dihydrolipoamide acetyltransferase)
MPSVFMPKLSDSMEEGTIVRWLVEDGAEVAAGDELAEIESDKAVMTYEAEAAGTLRLVAAEGESVAVGAVIAQLVGAGEIPEPAPVTAAPAAAQVAEAAPVVAAPAAGAAGRNGGRVNASPVARRVAEHLRIDLRTLPGTGPQGRVVKRDVELAAGGSGDSGADAPPATNGHWGAVVPEAPAAESAAGAKGLVDVREPSRVQATIARRMSDAKATMPEFTLTLDVDMDAAVELRDAFKALGDGAIVPSYNDFVVRAAALALRAHPRANAAFRDGHFELYDRVNVGVAVAAEDALLVPTVVDADSRSLGAIAADTRRLAAGARDGTLTAADLSGGTFSVSNLGMYGVQAFTAVLNPPQAAILAVGALERRPVVKGDELAIGHRMSLTLTCDHRILYGADAAAFLADIRTALEQPLRLAL